MNRITQQPVRTFPGTFMRRHPITQLFSNEVKDRSSPAQSRQLKGEDGVHTLQPRCPRCPQVNSLKTQSVTLLARPKHSEANLFVILWTSNWLNLQSSNSEMTHTDSSRHTESTISNLLLKVPHSSLLSTCLSRNLQAEAPLTSTPSSASKMSSFQLARVRISKNSAAKTRTTWIRKPPTIHREVLSSRAVSQIHRM